jgi:hypothetical protein
MKGVTVERLDAAALGYKISPPKGQLLLVPKAPGPGPAARVEDFIPSPAGAVHAAAEGLGGEGELLRLKRGVSVGLLCAQEAGAGLEQGGLVARSLRAERAQLIQLGGCDAALSLQVCLHLPKLSIRLVVRK